ncbi:MAG: COX15/CtaA family protein [Actinomycetota bacterium]
MTRLTAYLRRVQAEGFSPNEFLAICVGALFLLSIIVISGGVVRLTGSGLGCTTWPNCTGEHLVGSSNAHQLIEQINRFFTFIVCIGVALAAIAAWYRRPRRRDLLGLSLIMLIGVPAQGVVGAIVVWTKVNPFAVQLHMVLSLILIWTAVVMIVRSRQPDRGERVASVVPRVRRRVHLLAGWTVLTLLAGSVVTGTGPHAGDHEAKRFFGTATDIDGHALQWVTRAHSAVVWITVLVALSLLWSLRKLSHDREVLDAPLTAWLITALVQGAIGYIQYASGLPVGMVAMHLAGAATLTGVTAWLWCSTTKVAIPADEMIDAVLGG